MAAPDPAASPPDGEEHQLCATASGEPVVRSDDAGRLPGMEPAVATRLWIAVRPPRWGQRRGPQTGGGARAGDQVPGAVSSSPKTKMPWTMYTHKKKMASDHHG